jgi:hypothetical protein
MLKGFGGGDNFETARDITELAAHIHADAALDDARGAFGVEGNKIQGRAGFAGGGVLAFGAVFEESGEKFGGSLAGRTRDMRAADAGRGQSAFDGVGGVVVEFEILFLVPCNSRRRVRSRVPNTSLRPPLCRTGQRSDGPLKDQLGPFYCSPLEDRPAVKISL